MKLSFNYISSQETEAHYVIVKKNDILLMAISASTIGSGAKKTDGLYLYHTNRNDRTCDRDNNGCLKVIGVDIA